MSIKMDLECSIFPKEPNPLLNHITKYKKSLDKVAIEWKPSAYFGRKLSAPFKTLYQLGTMTFLVS